MKTITAIAALFALVMPSILGAASPEDLAAAVMSDLRQRDENKLSGISYTVTEITGDRVIVFSTTRDHNLKERNELIAVNGKPATQEEATRFAKERNKDTEKDPAKDGKKESLSIENLSEIIEPGSLKLESTDGESSRFSFIFDMKTAKGRSAKMPGTLVYDEAKRFVNRIRIENDKPFKPDSKAKVSVFVMEMRFEKNPTFNAVVPSSVHSRIKGTALFVIPFDEESDATFSNFARLNKSTSTAPRKE